MSNKRNPWVELLRFLFTMCVILAHYRTFYGLDYDKRVGAWQGHISVEFFLILSGLLMAASCNKMSDEPIYKSTWGFMFRKIKAIAPVYLIVLIINVVNRLIENSDHLDSYKTLYPYLAKVLPSAFMLQNLGLKENVNVGYGWYISAMILGMFIIYPLLYKYKKTFSLIAAPLIVIAYCSYAMHNYDSIILLDREWFGVCGTRLVRAISGLSMGVICYEISALLKQKWDDRLTKVGKASVYLLISAIFAFSFYNIFIGTASKTSLFMFVLFAGGITLLFSIGYGNIPDFIHNCCAFLGKISLSLYLSQGLVQIIYPTWEYSGRKGALRYVIYCIAAGLIVYALSLIIPRAIGFLWKKTKKLLIKKEAI